MNKTFKDILSYAAIIIGALLAAFSVACILLPNDAIDYGTAGVAIIISKMTGFSLSPCVLFVFLPFLKDWAPFRVPALTIIPLLLPFRKYRSACFHSRLQDCFAGPSCAVYRKVVQ